MAGGRHVHSSGADIEFNDGNIGCMLGEKGPDGL
jgi:hypothetical protein